MHGDANLDTNKELRLAPREHVSSVTQTRFPGNHDWATAWRQFTFVTNRGRTWQFGGWHAWANGSPDGMCGPVKPALCMPQDGQAITKTASAGKAITGLQFDMNGGRDLTGVMLTDADAGATQETTKANKHAVHQHMHRQEGPTTSFPQVAGVPCNDLCVDNTQVYNTCCNWHHHCGRCRAHCECEPAASLRT